MSAARVLNPMLSRNLPCGRQLSRIKRDLFGQASPVETTRMFSEELDKHQEKACKKWGFDFRAGLPLQCNSQFVWERVAFPESSYTPEMYTLTRAAHVRPTVPVPTTMDLRMDERAERENFMANISGSSATDTDSCDDSQDESMPVAFKLPAAIAGACGAGGMAMDSVAYGLSRTAAKRRQPKITEYMKERKRLAQTPKKLNSSPPAKRMRTSSGGSSGSTGSTGNNATHFFSHQHSISMHFSMQRRQQQNHQHQQN